MNIGMDMWSDRSSALSAVSHSGLTLRYAPDAIKNDRDIVREAVMQNGRALVYASPELCGDMEIVLAAVTQSHFALQWAAPKLRANKKVVMAAVKSHGVALEFADEAIQGNDEIALAAVNQNGMSLEHASAHLRSCPDIALAAITKSADAVQFASRELLADRSFVLSALALNSNTLTWASVELRKDHHLLVAAMVQRGYERRDSPTVSRAEREEVLGHVAKSGISLLYTTEYRENSRREIVLAAVVGNGSVLAFSSEELTGDIEILLTATTESRYEIVWNDDGHISLKLLKNTGKHQNAKMSLRNSLKKKSSSSNIKLKEKGDKFAELSAYIEKKLASRDYHLVMMSGSQLVQRLAPTAPSPLYHKWGTCDEEACEQNCNACIVC